jgi:hypothetical protein
VPVSVPARIVLANSGMALGPLGASMTSWSRFGMPRIVAREAPKLSYHE